MRKINTTQTLRLTHRPIGDMAVILNLLKHIANKIHEYFLQNYSKVMPQNTVNDKSTWVE